MSPGGDLIPRPRSVTPVAGAVTLTPPFTVSAPPAWRHVVERFAADLRESVGWEVRLVAEGSPAEVTIGVAPGRAPEGYGLSVTDVVRVEASTASGARHALTTLRQLGPVAWWSRGASLNEARLDGVVIDDEPRYAWRGVHLDVARHFFGVAEVTRLIDLVAAHRLNRLHLHLNDDQGWRVEVPSWPRLTEVGATRPSSPLGHESDGLDDAVPHGGYFTAQDLQRLRTHAASRGVVIVPEIDLPGHAQAAIAAYPELGNTDEKLGVWTRWGISPHVLNAGEGALAFAEEVAVHVASLFPDSPVHIGGDECPTTEWEASAAAREVMARHGFVEARQLQGLFTKRMAEALRRRGHEVIAWDEVLEADVPDGVVIAAWRGVDRAEIAARRGLDVIMAPMQYLYLDWLSSDRPDEPVALGPAPLVTTWERVYSFGDVLAGLDSVVRARVRGVQAQLWTEYIATRDHLDYMAFPRLAALSEVAWGTTEDVGAFRRRLAAHVARLDARGVRYRPLDGP